MLPHQTKMQKEKKTDMLTAVTHHHHIQEVAIYKHCINRTMLHFHFFSSFKALTFAHIVATAATLSLLNEASENNKKNQVLCFKSEVTHLPITFLKLLLDRKM